MYLHSYLSIYSFIAFIHVNCLTGCTVYGNGPNMPQPVHFMKRKMIRHVICYSDHTNPLPLAHCKSFFSAFNCDSNLEGHVNPNILRWSEVNFYGIDLESWTSSAGPTRSTSLLDYFATPQTLWPQDFVRRFGSCNALLYLWTCSSKRTASQLLVAVSVHTKKRRLHWFKRNHLH